MKKKIGIFIFIVICSTVMLSDWIERIYIGRLAGLPGRYNSYVGIQKEQKDSIDMLVLGDSESMTSISPMELWKSVGITSYICGQSGQRISESYYMLKHALDYHHRSYYWKLICCFAIRIHRIVCAVLSAIQLCTIFRCYNIIICGKIL